MDVNESTVSPIGKDSKLSEDNDVHIRLEE